MGQLFGVVMVFLIGILSPAFWRGCFGGIHSALRVKIQRRIYFGHR
jgi:hypothetical protein